MNMARFKTVIMFVVLLTKYTHASQAKLFYEYGQNYFQVGVTNRIFSFGL